MTDEQAEEQAKARRADMADKMLEAWVNREPQPPLKEGETRAPIEIHVPGKKFTLDNCEIHITGKEFKRDA